MHCCFLSSKTVWALINFFCFQAVEILKTAREITMRVRYFPYSKCLLAPNHFSLGTRLLCIPADSPGLSSDESEIVGVSQAVFILENTGL